MIFFALGEYPDPGRKAGFHRVPGLVYYQVAYRGMPSFNNSGLSIRSQLQVPV